MSSTLFREEAILHVAQKDMGGPGLNPLKPLVLLTLLLVVCFVLIAVLVSSAEFARKQEVTGQIDTTTNTLVANEFGHLESLFVEEGQAVSPGDELGQLVSTLPPKGANELTEKQLDALQELGRIAHTSLLEGNQHAMKRDRQLTHISQLTREDIRLQQSKVAQLQQQVERSTRLHQDGYLSTLDFLRFRQSLITEQQALNNLKQQLASRTAERLALRQTLDDLKERTSRQLAEIQLRQSEIRQVMKDRASSRVRTLVATSAGKISRVEVKEGSYLLPGQPILHIGAPDNELTGSVYLPSGAMAEINVGQTLSLVFDGYPDDRYGKVPAIILSVKHPQKDDHQGQFVARLSISQSNAKMTLLSGMTFRTHVVVETRSVLAWLLRPVLTLAQKN